MKPLEKITLDHGRWGRGRLNVSDGHLSAFVGRYLTQIGWVSKGDENVRETLSWDYSEAPYLTVYDGTKTGMGFPHSVDREPTHLIKYEAQFRGVHRNFDRIFDMYKNGDVEKELDIL